MVTSADNSAKLEGRGSIWMHEIRNVQTKLKRGTRCEIIGIPHPNHSHHQGPIMAVKNVAADTTLLVDYNYQPTPNNASYSSRVSRCCKYPLSIFSHCTLGIAFIFFLTSVIIFCVSPASPCIDYGARIAISSLGSVLLLSIFILILWIICHYQCGQSV